MQLEAFMSRLLVLVPGCPAPLAQQALVDAAIEFCENTHVVQVITAPVNLVPDQFTYAYTLPADQETAALMAVWVEGRAPLDLVPRSEVNTQLGYFPSAGQDTRPKGTPRSAFYAGSNSASLFPTPDQAATNALAFKVATRPTRTATTLDDSLFNDWAEAIAAGATYRIASTAGQMYSSPAIAATGLATFRYYMNRARSQASKNRVKGNTTVNPLPLAGGRK